MYNVEKWPPYFKNIVVFTPRDFLRVVSRFSTLCMKRLRCFKGLHKIC